MNSMIKQGMRGLIGVTIGGATMKAIGDSSMPQGFKDVAQLGVAVGTLGYVMPRGTFGSLKQSHHHKRR